MTLLPNRSTRHISLPLLLAIATVSQGATMVNFHDLTDSVTVDTNSTSAILGQGVEMAMFSDSFQHAVLTPAGVVTGTIDLLEPDGSVSDIIELTLNQGFLTTTVLIRFTSDTEGGPALAQDPNARTPMEPAGIHDYAPLFRGIAPIGDILPADFVINAESDIEAVPEPRTGLLLASGLAFTLLVRKLLSGQPSSRLR